MTHRLTQLLRGVVATAVLVGIVAGVPWLLATGIGMPLPDGQIDLATIRSSVQRGIVPDSFFLYSLTIAAWVLWAWMTASIAVETVAWARGHAPDLSAGPVRRWAAQLIAAAAMSFTTTVSTAAAAPLSMLPAAATEPIMPQPTPPADNPRVITGDADAGATTEPSEVIVNPGGGTWMLIAEAHLQAGHRWREVRNLNLGRTMPDGTVITTSLDQLEPGWPILVPPAATAPTPAHTDVPDRLHDVLPPAATPAPSARPATDDTRTADDTATADEPNDQPAMEQPTADAADSDAAGASEDLVVVEPGEHFWSLAVDEVAEQLQRPGTVDEVDTYWRELVDANRDRLAVAGDPDMIYPGQQFVVPDVTDVLKLPSATAPAPAADPQPPPNLEQPPADQEPGDSTSGIPTGNDSWQTDTTDATSDPDGDIASAPASPAVPLPGSRNVPAGRPDTARADDAATDADPTNDNAAEDDDGEVGALVPIGALSIAAAGIWAAIQGLRRWRLARRQRGTYPMFDTSTPVAPLLAGAADQQRLARLDAALRHLSAFLPEDQMLPTLLVRLTSAGDVELLHDRVVDHAPPAPWRVTYDGESWMLDASAQLDASTVAAGALLPTLVTLGTHRNGLMLIDLARANHLSLNIAQGSATTVDDVVATMSTMALELACSPLADVLQVVCVGFGHALADLERVTVVEDLGQLDRELDHTAAAAERATAADGPSHRGPDGIEPVVVFDPYNETRVATHAARTTGVGVVAVVTASPDAATIVELDGDTITLPSLPDASMTRRDFTADEMADIAHLVRDAQDPIVFDADAEPDAAHRHLASVSRHQEPTDTHDTGDRSHVAVSADPAPAPAAADVDTAGRHWDWMVRVLGPLEIVDRDGNAPRERIRRRPTRSLIAYLALHRRGGSRDVLESALWTDGRNVDNRVAVVASEARKVLGTMPDGSPYVPNADDSVYHVHDTVVTDLEILQHALAVSRTSAPDIAAAALDDALDLVVGEPFIDVVGHWADTLGHTTDAVLAIDDTAQRLAEIALSRGELDVAFSAVRRGLLGNPGSVELHRLAMRAAIETASPDRIKATYDHYVAEATAGELAPEGRSDLDPEIEAMYRSHRPPHAA